MHVEICQRSYQPGKQPRMKAVLSIRDGTSAASDTRRADDWARGLRSLNPGRESGIGSRALPLLVSSTTGF